MITYTVIGAGVVGLACARALAQGLTGEEELVLIEKEKSFGQGISSRNSEVIHSGIYYPHNSLKHRMCLEGRRLLYDYADRRKVPYKKCGKLIIATNESELPDLEELYTKAVRNEVEHVRKISGTEALAMEPDIRVCAAVHSPETGIIDTHAYMKALEQDVAEAGGMTVYGSAVTAITRTGDGYLLTLSDGTEFSSRIVINCAGLYATDISAMLGLRPEKLYPCKGNYFYYAGTHNVTHLVYPIPHKHLTGLGVHVTLDLNGRMKFGPDTEYIDGTEDYTVDEKKREEFFMSAQKLVNGLRLENICPDMAGIRPKIQGPNDTAVKDFYIRDEKEAGFPGFIDLLGIESPGLTSSLAIAQYVQDLCN